MASPEPGQMCGVSERSRERSLPPSVAVPGAWHPGLSLRGLSVPTPV